MFYTRAASSREQPAQHCWARGRQPFTCSSRGSAHVPAALACGDEGGMGGNWLHGLGAAAPCVRASGNYQALGGDSRDVQLLQGNPMVPLSHRGQRLEPVSDALGEGKSSVFSVSFPPHQCGCPFPSGPVHSQRRRVCEHCSQQWLC